MASLIERPFCTVCGSKENELLIELPLDHGPVSGFLSKFYGHRSDGEFSPGQNFSLCQCKLCDFIWQRWILDEAGMHLLYDNWIDPIGSYQKNRTHPFKYYQHLFADISFVSLFFPNKRPNQIKALDFGMGWASWARMGRACGIDVYGSELSNSRIKHAKEIGIPLIDDFKAALNKFDYINTEQVLEHISDIHSVMTLLVGILKPGGILRVSVPPVRKELGLLRAGKWIPSHDAFHPLEHVNGFTWKSIKKLSQTHGLKIAPPGFFIRLALEHPTKSAYIMKRMITHFFLNNVLLIKSQP